MPKLTKHDDDDDHDTKGRPPEFGEPGPPPHAQGPKDKPEPKDEQSKPSGKQDATLPGSTPETSSQIPKPGESTDKGKGPLKFDPNAPAVETVARRDQMRVEGQLDEGKGPGQQIHSSAVLPDRGPERAWEDQIIQAAQGAYPRLRLGVDYEVGRKDFESPPELLGTAEGVEVDFEKIKKAAEKLAGQNPYAGYQPKPPLHGGFAPKGTEGEVDPNRTLPGNVAQSEVNPQTNDKVASQAYPPPPSQEGAPPSPRGRFPESQSGAPADPGPLPKSQI